AGRFVIWRPRTPIQRSGYPGSLARVAATSGTVTSLRRPLGATEQAEFFQVCLGAPSVDQRRRRHLNTSDTTPQRVATPSPRADRRKSQRWPSENSAAQATVWPQ